MGELYCYYCGISVGRSPIDACETCIRREAEAGRIQQMAAAEAWAKRLGIPTPKWPEARNLTLGFRPVRGLLTAGAV